MLLNKGQLLRSTSPQLHSNLNRVNIWLHIASYDMTHIPHMTSPWSHADLALTPFLPNPDPILTHPVLSDFILTSSWPHPDLNLTLPWHYPDLTLTSTWPQPDLTLTLLWHSPDLTRTYPNLTLTSLWPPFNSLRPHSDLTLTLPRPYPDLISISPWTLPWMNISGYWAMVNFIHVN